MLRFSILAYLLFSFITSSSAQQSSSVGKSAEKQNPPSVQSAKPQPEAAKEPSQDEVVKLGVTLVQVDAVVTDKNGRHVTDLTADDFEIFEDGRKQKITNFSYVKTQENAVPLPLADKTKRTDKTAPPMPPVNLRPEQVRRTIALVVDDLGLSFESVAGVRLSLKKFVDEQMQAGDFVAIIRTGAGVGALQQFTSDKRLLYAAIERVRWNPSGRGGLAAIAAIGTDDPPSGVATDANDANSPEARADARAQNNVDQLRDEIFSVGTIGTLHFVARGLKNFPGRKSVILFSDGLALFSHNGDDNTRVLEALRRLIDLANRSSVVFYTIDSRGLQTLGPSAADNLGGKSPRSFDSQIRKTREGFHNSQEGLVFLAKETGGLAALNSNDLSRGVGRALEDQKGFYLIGYIPEESTFKTIAGRTAYHKFNLKVKRAGLEVRTRTGFFGVPEASARAVNRTREQQLYEAIASPFTSGEIPLHLTSLFAYDEKAGLILRSMLHIDISKLTFTDTADGMKKTDIDLGAVTFKDTGQVIDQVWKNFTLTIPANNFASVSKRGLVYMIALPVKKHGAYQLRAVVRDSAAALIGSANQFVEVPDINKGRLVISGIVAQGAKSANAKNSQPSQAAEGAQGNAQEDDPQSGPALRKIQNHSMMEYRYEIYNAQLDKATNLPRLDTQVLVLKEGQVMYTGKVNPVAVEATQNLKKILTGGRLNFMTFEPGEYVLQVIVTDKLAKGKQNQATHWIDFEIVK